MDITAILNDVQDGIPGATNRLAKAVFDDLHRIADAAMKREQSGHTLQPTELVDAAFLKAIGQQRIPWQNRAHFFAVAAQTIRRILVDHARARRRQKRDFGVRVTFDEAMADSDNTSLDLIALDDALQKLDASAPRQAKVVELRFFGGLEIDETAHALGISTATVKRDWIFARAFLLKSLEEGT
ncbi:MAG TPA: ECF-type sigma factor [Gemmatimonadaceae bacterium]